jgi:hypothetical protein
MHRNRVRGRVDCDDCGGYDCNCSGEFAITLMITGINPVTRDTNGMSRGWIVDV